MSDMTMKVVRIFGIEIKRKEIVITLGLVGYDLF